MGIIGTNSLVVGAGLLFPPEWVKAALVLAFLCTWVLVGFFWYLNYYTRKGYFQYWTAAWVFFSVYLAASIGREALPALPFLVMTRRAFIGFAALFMFWGSFQLGGKPRRQRELALGIVGITVWNLIAAVWKTFDLWVTIPMFFMLAAASYYTGRLHGGETQTTRGTRLLAAGFYLWGLHLLAFPLEDWMSPDVMVINYFFSACLSLYIAIAMILQVLEQARERSEAILDRFNQDRARRRLLEQEAAVTEQKYRALFDSAQDAIFLVDLDTLEIIEANEAAQELTRRDADHLVRLSFQDLFPMFPIQRDGMLDRMKSLDTMFKQTGECQLYRLDGTKVVCEGDWNLLPVKQRSMLQVRMRDITERKTIEQQLRQSEKLSALGQLVAGVAHEVNNPLAMIMGYAQLLSREESLPEKARQDLHKIQRESERATKIVRNLLMFSRKSDPQLTPVNLNRLVSTVVDSRSDEAREQGVTFDVRLADALPMTMADGGQLEQVLTNLLGNSIQALAARESDRRISVVTEHSGSHVWITVADNGPGIPKDIMARIFEPFFTTKKVGKGTGLGLTISYSIIEAHHGKMLVDSEPGKGAKFTLQLPLVPCKEVDDSVGDAYSRAGASHVASQGMGRSNGNGNGNGHGSRRILVVDDEPGLLSILTEVLRNATTTVDSAGNGMEAMQWIEKNRYDMIVSDMRMPDMDGEALYNTLRETNRPLSERILFLTGDTVSPGTRAFLEKTGNRWLNKPFNITDLERTVEEVLCDTSGLDSTVRQAGNGRAGVGSPRMGG
jgi:PAS domain S-box-containing protein